MEDRKEDLQRKILEFQIAESELKVIEEREEALIRNLEDLNRTRLALEELRNTKPNVALIPLGGSNFVHGNITDSDSIIVGIGANIAVKKTKDQALEILDERIRHLEQTSEKFAAQAQNIFDRLKTLQTEIEKLQK